MPTLGSSVWQGTITSSGRSPNLSSGWGAYGHRTPTGDWGFWGKNPTITLPAANVTTLSEGVWTDGNLSANGEQLFKFTATTTGGQYILLYFGTLTSVNVAVYDSDGYIMYPGESTRYMSSSIIIDYILSVTSGQTYYIRVTPYSDNTTSLSGTYKVALNTSYTPPAITLPTANVTTLNEGAWEEGDLPQYGEQWYKFTATVTGTGQYIHASLGTLTSLYVQTYNSDGTRLEYPTNLFSSTRYTNRTVTTGQTYYIRVVPYSYGSTVYSGTYKIAFNQSTTAPVQ
jgi:hypothetical protein